MPPQHVFPVCRLQAVNLIKKDESEHGLEDCSIALGIGHSDYTDSRLALELVVEQWSFCTSATHPFWERGYHNRLFKWVVKSRQSKTTF
jgi:hypothetical protein